MTTLPVPKRAVVRRTRGSHQHAVQELLLALRDPQTPIRGRWIVKLFLEKLPPAQPPLPSILPRFNPSLPLQSFLPSPTPPGIRPQLNPGPPPQSVLPSHVPLGVMPQREETIAYINAFFDEPYSSPNERYDQRLADLKNLLSPLTQGNDDSGDGHKHGDSGFVLLCWGSSSSCRVLAVNHVERDIDQELFWRKLQKAWYDARGRWQQRLPFYEIRRVKQVKIRLVGPDPKSKGLFHGVYKPADEALETEKQKLKENMKESMKVYKEKSMSRFPDGSSPDPDDVLRCQYYFRRGYTIHDSVNCPEHWGDPELGISGSPCPVGEYFENRERLAKLEMEPLRTLLFRNPKMAVYNELENADLVHDSESVLYEYQYYHCSSLGRPVFRGLHIEDGWAFDPIILAAFMPIAAMTSILIVLVARLIYGDWGVAWNVGACFVPLLISLGSWLRYAEVSG